MTRLTMPQSVDTDRHYCCLDSSPDEMFHFDRQVPVDGTRSMEGGGEGGEGDGHCRKPNCLISN